MRKLSIILPCYNVERYIADCLDSIYTQDLTEDEFEVICVNDCSTDGTREVIENYASHSNLTLIDHAENLTAGGARNTGIKAAKGEYIWFVDPDDMVKLNCLHELCSFAINKAVDVLIFNFSMVDEHLNPLQNRNVFYHESEILSGQEFVMKYTPGSFSVHCMVWRCLFKTIFLRGKDLYYPIMRKAQDVSFLWKVMLVAERVASVSGVYYTYRSNPYSVAKKPLDAHVMFSDRILRAYEIDKMLNDEKNFIQAPLKKDMETALRWCVNSNLDLLRQMSVEEREHYYDEIVHNWEGVSCVRPYMNRKQTRLFSIGGGKHLWMLKVKFLVLWENCRKNDHLR